ncbi:uncharacterized protein [Ptychodera flava]|uniref:uncharacterized protein n=1 Tax=Ptychodera flava TaxID=63121 RepID=UPI00396AAC43
MKPIIAILCALIAVEVRADDGEVHSSQWPCVFASVRVYDDAVWNVVITQGVECPDDVVEIPELVKNKTPAKAFHVYHNIGPFIESTSSFRLTSVVADKVDKINLGEKLSEEGNDRCLNCTLNYFKDDLLEVICKPFDNGCPGRLAEGLNWGQPEGTIITHSSPVEYCSFHQVGDSDYYYCKDYHPDIPMVE